MKKLKIGIFGFGERGKQLSKTFMLANCDIVAVCDNRERCKNDAKNELGKDVAIYNDFDAFIEHDMEAVILTNYFHEHAPFAVRCFEKGLHVYSECISNGTMADGVALIRAFEKSNCVYMIGENYPQMIFNREMRRVRDSGTLGKIIYAEGEYNHPIGEDNRYYKQYFNYFREHWRNYLPATYYITHSLGPIMWITGATPKRVTAFAMFEPYGEDEPTARRSADRAAIITTQNDDGSIFRVTACSLFGGHHNAYRVCGTKGQIENLRGMDTNVMLRYNDWEIPEGAKEINYYEPKWNDKDEDIIVKSGHGGGDYLTARIFVESVSNGVQPEHPYDIYSAVTMSSVAILAHKSVLNNGQPYDIPDFKNSEDARKQYENDFDTPFWSNGKAPTLPQCSHTDYAPTEKQLQGNDAIYLK